MINLEYYSKLKWKRTKANSLRATVDGFQWEIRPGDVKGEYDLFFDGGYHDTLFSLSQALAEVDITMGLADHPDTLAARFGLTEPNYEK